MSAEMPRTMNVAETLQTSRPLVVSVPHPRSLDLIFTPQHRATLFERYRIVETEPEAFESLPEEILREARYILGQPAIDAATLARLRSLRCVFNVESNLIDNMPYATLFERGIHIVTTGAVFALPVAELGMAMALEICRGVGAADEAFRAGRELWGMHGNGTARLLSGSEIGIIGFGELGRALTRILAGFRPKVRAFDPWLPQSTLREQGVEPASLEEVMGQSDFVFVTAAVTTENKSFLGSDEFRLMRRGAALILLSRAEIVDFHALMNAVRAGHIRAASDVFPQEPLALDHPVRALNGFIRSAHRAGALDAAFKRMGEMVLEDMELIDRDLPPVVCKRAERETVSRMRSRPVTLN